MTLVRTRNQPPNPRRTRQEKGHYRGRRSFHGWSNDQKRRKSIRNEASAFCVDFSLTDWADFVVV